MIDYEKICDSFIKHMQPIICFQIEVHNKLVTIALENEKNTIKDDDLLRKIERCKSDLGLVYYCLEKFREIIEQKYPDVLEIINTVKPIYEEDTKLRRQFVKNNAAEIEKVLGTIFKFEEDVH